VLLHAGYQNDILLLYRGLREAAWRPRMVIGTGAGYSLTDTAHAIGPDFEGTLNVDVPQYELNERFAPGVKPFIELYRKRYGSDPRSGHSLSNYVGARASFDAIQRAAAPDRGPHPRRPGRDRRGRRRRRQWLGHPLRRQGPEPARPAPPGAMAGREAGRRRPGRGGGGGHEGADGCGRVAPVADGRERDPPP
jgi:hypothetical protein